MKRWKRWLCKLCGHRWSEWVEIWVDLKWRICTRCLKEEKE